jgi:hypothetical protein
VKFKVNKFLVKKHQISYLMLLDKKRVKKSKRATKTESSRQRNQGKARVALEKFWSKFRLLKGNICRHSTIPNATNVLQICKKFEIPAKPQRRRIVWVGTLMFDLYIMVALKHFSTRKRLHFDIISLLCEVGDHLFHGSSNFYDDLISPCEVWGKKHGKRICPRTSLN